MYACIWTVSDVEEEEDDEGTPYICKEEIIYMAGWEILQKEDCKKGKQRQKLKPLKGLKFGILACRLSYCKRI